MESTSIDFDLDLSTPMALDGPKNKTSMEINENQLCEFDCATATTALATNDINEEVVVPIEKPHDATLKNAIKWKIELETMRDGMYLLSVKNAILLDSLTMAGADM
jgi:hypothetical protein